MFQVHAAKGPEVPLQPWEPGDVLGLALDFSSGKMQLSHQGTWHTEAGYSMDFQSNGRDLYPAVTMKWGMFRLRLGREAWIYQPPSAKHRPWAAGVGEWASEALLGDRSWGFDAQLLARKPRMIGLGALGDCEAPRSASSWFVAGLPELSRSSGKFYYELRLLSRPESPRVGWATADFSGGAIGGDPESFAFEGWRMMKWNAGLSSQAALKPWRPGDVLGLAVDLDAGKMSLRCHRDDGWLRIKSVSLEEARRMLQASIDDGDISDSELSEVVTFLGQEGRILEEDRSDDTVYIEMSDGNATWVPATMLKALLEDEEPEDVREMHFDPKGRKLHPAASMLGGFRCYLGRDAWLYEPPGAEYEAWGSGVFEWAPEDWRAGSTCAGKPCLVGLRCLRPTELPMEEGWRDGFQELRSLWLTAGAKEAARGSGKLYHEIQLISDLSNPQVGWMSTKFKEGEQDGNGLGDDEEGYGFDGDRHLQWKAGKSMKVKIQPWKQGTVLGLAIDLDAGVMRLSHQGKWHNENEEGYIIKAELTGRDWYPAISMRGFYQMHLDRRTWRFTPPSPDYEAWASGIFEWAPQHF
ncbi:kidins220 [Symbiodinium natans]|uniref:Kidins220 protein n=1 Tax=Symbiodinium natans TaxID=878477 RepID=A0A812HZ40_9DINO|nr:kidins220 [Symbiodinium natans]